MIFSLRCFLILLLLIFLNNSAYSCTNATLGEIISFCNSEGLTDEQIIKCDYALKKSKNACHIPGFIIDKSRKDLSNCSDLYGCPDEDYKVGVVDDESIMRLLDSSLKNLNNSHNFRTSAESDTDKRNIEQLCNKEINTLEVYKQCKFYLDKFGYKNLGANSAVDKAYKKLFAEDIAKKKNDHQKIANTKDHRGKWGLNFRMTFKEVGEVCSEKSSKCKKNGVEFGNFSCLPGSRYQFESGQFIENICENFGKLTSEKWKKIEKQLNSKYKLLIPTEKEDWEEMISGEGIVYALYKNEVINDEPTFIQIRSRSKITPNGIYNPILVIYHSTNQGEQIIKDYNEENQILEDL